MKYNLNGFGKAAIQAEIIDIIYNEYKGNPRALSKDAGSCQRAASYWLEAKHLPSTKFILNLTVNNKKIYEAFFVDLFDKIRRGKSNL